MHRIALALIVAASSLVVSTAHADLFCGSFLAGNYRPDEMTSSVSQAKAETLLACACETTCLAACTVYVPEDGANACGLYGTYFAEVGGDQDACGDCISSSCGAPFFACYFDH